MTLIGQVSPTVCRHILLNGRGKMIDLDALLATLEMR